MKTPCDSRKVSMILHGQLATPSFILLSKVDADIYVKSLRKVRFGVQSYIPQLRKINKWATLVLTLELVITIHAIKCLRHDLYKA